MQLERANGGLSEVVLRVESIKYAVKYGMILREEPQFIIRSNLKQSSRGKLIKLRLSWLNLNKLNVN